jgi:shikimate dehydrogenase
MFHSQSPITGATRLAGVLGWPVSHSLSPRMHNAAYAALGLSWIYVPLPVPPERLGDAVRGVAALGFAGANVTVPHKAAVVPLMDELTPIAAAIGAVNTITVRPDGTLLGDNTDGGGLMRDLAEHGVEVGQRMAADRPLRSEKPDVTAPLHHPVTASPCHRVIVLGAGGAARAVVYALAQAGVELTIVNRTLDKAQALCQTMGAALPGAADRLHAALPQALPALAAEAELIVNTTSLGLHAGDPLPWDAAIPFRRGQVVYDLIYNRPTELLALARAQGATAIAGLGMLIHQGALSAAQWTGHDAGELARLMRKELERV